MTQATAVRAEAIEDTLLHRQEPLDRFFNNRLQICLRVGSLAGSTTSQPADPWGSVGTATDELCYFPARSFVPIQLPVVLYQNWGRDEIARTRAEAFLNQDSAWIGFVGNMIGNPTVQILQTENEFVVEAVEEFEKLNAATLGDSPSTLDSAIKIINFAIQQGYRPVVTVDDEDNSLEIETKLDSSRLLLLQVWGSGNADGVVFFNGEDFSHIEATTITGVLEWLTSADNTHESSRSL